MTMKPLCFGAIIACVLLAGCDKATTDPTQAPAPKVRAAMDGKSVAAPDKNQDKMELVDFQTGPIENFAAACERCHGPEGDFFEGQFKHTEPEDLKGVVEEMMVGPGMLSPSPSDLAAMTAYMEAIQKDVPFAIALNGASVAQGKDKNLKGEVTAETDLKIKWDPETQAIESKQNTWSIPAPSAKAFLIEAQRDGKSEVLNFPEAQWTSAL